MDQILDDVGGVARVEGREEDPVHVEFEEALAEMNSLTVRLEATKQKNLQWKQQFANERRKLVESMRTALYQYDKMNAGKKHVSTPPKMPEVRPGGFLKSNEPTREGKSMKMEVSPRNKTHLQLGKVKSRSPFTPTLLDEVPDDDENIEEAKSLYGKPTNNIRKTKVKGNISPQPGASTNRSGAASKTVSIDLQRSTDRFDYDDDDEDDDNDDEDGRPRAATCNSPNDPAYFSDGVNATHQKLRSTMSLHAAMYRQKTQTPNLLVASRKPRTSVSAGRRPGSRLVHRAAAMDLDEMKRVAERTFQRYSNHVKQNSKSRYKLSSFQ